ncbi:MAG: hypothetical protein QM765_51285 [Myxococcales bacterium]
MAHRLPLIALLLLSSAAAYAAPDELAAKAIEIAQNSSLANKGTLHGEVLQGSGKSAEWTVELAGGTWYSFALRTSSKKASLALFAPGGKDKVFSERARDQQFVTRLQATMSGTYKLAAKMDPAGDVRIAVFAEPKGAGGDVLAERALTLTKKTAPGATQVGQVLSAAGRQVEWRVDLQAGHCYWFGAETSGKALAEYLFDPGDHKIAQVEPDLPEGMLTYCATINGSHKLIARTAPPSDVRVAVFGKEGAHEEVRKTQNPSLASSLTCTNEGTEGTGSLAVSCGGCVAMDLWIDGQHQQMPPGTTSWQLDGMSAGCHTVKLNGWNSPFHYDLWYDGRATVGTNKNHALRVARRHLPARRLQRHRPAAPARQRRGGRRGHRVRARRHRGQQGGRRPLRVQALRQAGVHPRHARRPAPRRRRPRPHHPQDRRHARLR